MSPFGWMEIILLQVDVHAYMDGTWCVIMRL